MWHGAFRAFLRAVVERRSQHVALWLNENMASFPDDPEALAVQVLAPPATMIRHDLVCRFGSGPFTSSWLGPWC